MLISLRRAFSVLFSLLTLSSFLLLPNSATANPAAEDYLWRDTTVGALPSGDHLVTPERYRLLEVDLAQMSGLLSETPLEVVGDASTWDSAVVIPLPLPDGSLTDFRVIESPVMAPELAAKYPQLRTFLGVSTADPAVGVRLDLTPLGFHAIIFTPGDTVYIDPIIRGNNYFYACYNKRDDSNPKAQAWVDLGPLTAADGPTATPPTQRSLTSGEELRTYRLAVAATGEYTQWWGGSVGDGLAAVMTAVNRITGVYEREIAVRLQLVPNNDLIIYTEPYTDPYANNNIIMMLNQNQDNLDEVIGASKYDIGHVLATSNGGASYAPSVCWDGIKAGGVSGSPEPNNGPFVIDYIAHEMGHQFSANHSYNGISGSCSGGRWSTSAYEPGSGTTIMSYAGICDEDDIQLHSDDTFHSINWQEIIDYTHNGLGNGCAVTTQTGNLPPVVEAGSGDFTIPINTPFMLTGSGYDPDGDAVTFSWEEFDLGPGGHPWLPVGNAPIFRSFPPVDMPVRIFPQITDIISGTQTIGELLPTYSRTLSFRLTARDNQVAESAGGVAYDAITFTVSANAGPFLVLYPNEAVTWHGGTFETILWDVAGTDAVPVSCSTVDLALSTDGGYSYPVILSEGTPNDGSELITIPQLETGRARLRVMCATSIFFDISNEDFTILPQDTAQLTIDKTINITSTLSPGDWITYTITAGNSGTLLAVATITDTFHTILTNSSCNGIPGDLIDQITLNPSDQISYTCPAQVNPDLYVEVSLVSDRTQTLPGETVVYTVTVTNPDSVATFMNILLTGENLPGCPPEFFEPFDLAPSSSQQFVCSGSMPQTPITSLVSVIAEVQLYNRASISAPEDPRGILFSPLVVSVVNLFAEDEITVQPLLPLFLPFVTRGD